VNQRNEIVSLREQLSKKDRRIQQLEEELQALQAVTSTTGHGFTTVA